MRLLGDVKTAASLIVTTDTAWPALPLATEELDEEVVHHAYAAITNQHYPASREGAKALSASETNALPRPEAMCSSP